LEILRSIQTIISCIFSPCSHALHLPPGPKTTAADRAFRTIISARAYPVSWALHRPCAAPSAALIKFYNAATAAGCVETRDAAERVA